MAEKTYDVNLFNNLTDYSKITPIKDEDMLLSGKDQFAAGIAVDAPNRAAVIASQLNLPPDYVFNRGNETYYIPRIDGKLQDLNDVDNIKAYQATSDLSDIAKGDFRSLLYFMPDAMEIGADAVLLNTAVAQSKNPEKMAHAMNLAVKAGRLGHLAGRMEKKYYANASSPLKNISQSFS